MSIRVDQEENTLLPIPGQGDAGQPDSEASLWPVPQIRGSAMSDGHARLRASICREHGRLVLELSLEYLNFGIIIWASIL